MIATQTLFGEHVRNRPKRSDPAVLAHAVAMMGERLQRDFPDLEWNEFAAQELSEAMRHDSDGYAIAKSLDRKGWAVDARMVETLDWNTQLDAHAAAVKAWVTAEGITPTLSIGSVVTCQGRDGEITRIDDKEATYTVCIRALGHVKEGLGTHGLIVPYEAVESDHGRVDEARRDG